jgi:hypothetical protein
MDFELTCEVAKVDDSIGVVFGWGIVCTEGGEPYVDLQDDHIEEATMLKAAAAFAHGERVAKEMHRGAPAGTVLFVWPMTADIAKAVGVQSRRTGMLVGMRPEPSMLAKFRSGELRGFSIGGRGRRRRVEPAA